MRASVSSTQEPMKPESRPSSAQGSDSAVNLAGLITSSSRHRWLSNASRDSALRAVTKEVVGLQVLGGRNTDHRLVSTHAGGQVGETLCGEVRLCQVESRRNNRWPHLRAAILLGRKICISFFGLDAGRLSSCSKMNSIDCWISNERIFARA